MSWDGEPGCDFHGYPPHNAPSYLKPLGHKIFQAIQKELVVQVKHKHGWMVFRQDMNGHINIQTEGLNLGKLTEVLLKVIEANSLEEESQAQMAFGE